MCVRVCVSPLWCAFHQSAGNTCGQNIFQAFSAAYKSSYPKKNEERNPIHNNLLNFIRVERKVGERREWEGVIRAPYKELLPLLGNLLHYDYAKRAQSKERGAGGEESDSQM